MAQVAFMLPRPLPLHPLEIPSQIPSLNHLATGALCCFDRLATKVFQLEPWPTKIVASPASSRTRGLEWYNLYFLCRKDLHLLQL